MDNEDSAVHTKLSNIGSNDLELVLERSSLIAPCLNGSKNLVLTGVFVNDDG